MTQSGVVGGTSPMGIRQQGQNVGGFQPQFSNRQETVGFVRSSQVQAGNPRKKKKPSTSTRKLVKKNHVRTSTSVCNAKNQGMEQLIVKKS